MGHVMNALFASGDPSKRPLSPFAVPECGACMGQRLHTDAEWKQHHPLAGHGFTRESGWSHPDAETKHTEESAKAKGAALPATEAK